MRVKKDKRGFIAVFLIVSVFIGIFELSMRITGRLYLKNLFVRVHPDGVPSPDEVTVVCLGESSTAGIWVGRDESYPSQLRNMLMREYPGSKVRVVVPPHIGQNTSQMANRAQEYINLYKPSLVIIMAGYNNEWSLAESHIVKFLDRGSLEIMKIKALIFLDGLRLFRLLKYAYFRYIFNRNAPYRNLKMEAFENSRYVWGGPELVVSSDEDLERRFRFAAAHRNAFIRLWRYDMEKIIAAAKSRGVGVLLMTYHINPDYLPEREFVAMADKEFVVLARNDLSFQPLLHGGLIDNYLLHDKWHPNKEGYRIIASNALAAIRDNNLLAGR